MSQLYCVKVSQVHMITVKLEAEGKQEAAEYAQQGGGEVVDVCLKEPIVKRVEELGVNFDLAD